MTIVDLGLFTPSVVLDVARTAGLLADAGIDVREHAVASSPAQLRALADRELDLAITSPDNVLLYTGFADNPLGRTLPLTITAALDRGLGLSLWTRPGLAPREARILGVDVPVSGFALAARALLARHGLAPAETVSLGSTPRRRAALVAGECDITILGAGNELRAEADGCTRVATVEELGPYLGAVTVRMTSLEDARAQAADAVAGILVAVGAQIVAGEHDDAVVAAAGRLLELGPTAARRHLDVLRDARTGIVAGGRLERSAVDTLVALRSGAQDAAALSAVADRLVASASGPAR